MAEIARLADVRAAAKDWQTFSSALQGDTDWRLYKQLPLEVDPPLHAAYRSILGARFERPAIAALEPLLRPVAARLVKSFVASGHADAVRDLALPMVAASACIALGRPQDAAESIAWGVYAIEIDEAGRRDGSRLERYLKRVFAEVDATPGDDLFTAVASAMIDGRRLTDTERHGVGNLIVAAGRDTVITLLCGAIWHLGQDEAARRRLSAEPALIPVAVEELLRFLSPLARMERRMVADQKGSWGRARKDDIVVLSFLHANHDPDGFERPDELVLGRRPNAHVAFGSGPHTCIGLHLARLEARVFLEEFLRTASWRLGEDAQIAYERIGAADVPVEFERLPIEQTHA